MANRNLANALNLNTWIMNRARFNFDKTLTFLSIPTKGFFSDDVSRVRFKMGDDWYPLYKSQTPEM